MTGLCLDLDRVHFLLIHTHGFCLESTHFTQAERLSKLLDLLTLALRWPMRTGVELHQ
jgi:hypothetical protein